MKRLRMTLDIAMTVLSIANPLTLGFAMGTVRIAPTHYTQNPESSSVQGFRDFRIYRIVFYCGKQPGS